MWDTDGCWAGGDLPYRVEDLADFMAEACIGRPMIANVEVVDAVSGATCGTHAVYGETAEDFVAAVEDLVAARDRASYICITRLRCVHEK